MNFRRIYGLVWFKLRSGILCSRMHERGCEPPYAATAWLNGGKWDTDFGGEWVGDKQGAVVWKWRPRT